MMAIKQICDVNEVHAQAANKAANVMTTNTMTKIMQGLRNENGAALSRRSGISSEFCLFVLCTDHFLRFWNTKKYEISMVPPSTKSAKNTKHTFQCKKAKGPVSTGPPVSKPLLWYK